MALLTNKELIALQDQLNLEKVLQCKYQGAARDCAEPALRSLYSQCAEQHRQNYTCLLNHLH